jgi:hypothetical protein
MDAILDQDEPALRKLRRAIEIDGDSEPMLEDQRSRPGSYAAGGIYEVDVEILEFAIHVDGPRAGVPNRVCNNDVRWRRQKNLVAASNPE